MPLISSMFKVQNCGPRALDSHGNDGCRWVPRMSCLRAKSWTRCTIASSSAKRWSRSPAVASESFWRTQTSPLLRLGKTVTQMAWAWTSPTRHSTPSGIIALQSCKELSSTFLGVPGYGFGTGQTPPVASSELPADTNQPPNSFGED